MLLSGPSIVIIWAIAVGSPLQPRGGWAQHLDQRAIDCCEHCIQPAMKKDSRPLHPPFDAAVPWWWRSLVYTCRMTSSTLKRGAP
jgi:hypothetical protein